MSVRAEWYWAKTAMIFEAERGQTYGHAAVGPNEYAIAIAGDELAVIYSGDPADLVRFAERLAEMARAIAAR